jgi:predicted ATP-grasp superfamily ATP-dependent carboligase
MSIEYEHSYMQNLSIQKLIKWGGEGVMVFDATFHKNSVISWQSVLLVEEIGENYRSAASN